MDVVIRMLHKDEIREEGEEEKNCRNIAKQTVNRSKIIRFKEKYYFKYKIKLYINCFPLISKQLSCINSEPVHDDLRVYASESNIEFIRRGHLIATAITTISIFDDILYCHFNHSDREREHGLTNGCVLDMEPI